MTEGAPRRSPGHWWSAGKGDPTTCVLCGATFTLEAASVPCPGNALSRKAAE